MGNEKNNGMLFGFKLTIVLTDVQLTFVFSEYKEDLNHPLILSQLVSIIAEQTIHEIH